MRFTIVSQAVRGFPPFVTPSRIYEVFMATTKAKILTFVNSMLNRTESDIDIQIQQTLDDLSNLGLLREVNTDEILEDGDTSITVPTGYRDLISLVLINSSGNRQAPLEALRGGRREYHRLRESDKATGTPEFFVEFDNKFYLWRPANGDYTTEIEISKYHPKDVSDIEFGDEFLSAINFGTTYWVAVKVGLTRLINIWAPIYAQEKEIRRLNMPLITYIVE